MLLHVQNIWEIDEVSVLIRKNRVEQNEKWNGSLEIGIDDQNSK